MTLPNAYMGSYTPEGLDAGVAYWRPAELPVSIAVSPNQCLRSAKSSITLKMSEHKQDFFIKSEGDNDNSDMDNEHKFEAVEGKTCERKRTRNLSCASSDSEEVPEKTGKESELNSDIDASDTEELLTLHKQSRSLLQIFSSSSEEDEGLQENVDSMSDDTPETYSWSEKDFVPKLYNFDESNSGIKVQLSKDSTPLDVFKIFFSEELIADICEKTNNFHKNLAETKVHGVHSRVNTWTDTSPSEMYLFLAVTMLMPRMEKRSVREYWSNDELVKTDIFLKLMSKSRYEALLNTLQFSDNDTMNSHDPLIKLSPIIAKLRNSFSKSFYPYEYLCVDENLLLYRGRLFFKHYTPPKSIRFNIKSFVICDCKTGYILDFLIYSENTISEEVSSIGQIGNIVLTLLQSYEGKGHTLITEYLYTSPHLYNLLHEKKKTNAFGTVRKSRSNMPKIEEKLKRGECASRSTHNMLALKWNDRPDVWMLSTSHSDEFVETKLMSNNKAGKPKSVPKCIADYAELMYAVDKIDISLSTLQCIQTNAKGYKKYFFYLLDLAIYNAFVLHKSVSNKAETFRKFHLLLIKDILRKYPPSKVEPKGGRVQSDDLPFRLTERHFPTSCTIKENNKCPSRRRCIVCAKHNRRTDSRYECKQCNIGLCIEPCFEIYHTTPDY